MPSRTCLRATCSLAPAAASEPSLLFGMSLLVITDAIVLHAFEYLESSRIVKLATRDAGVQSAVAKGARRPRSRFGAALDLFAEGSAHLHMRPTRDLQTLSAFEVARARPQLAGELERFAAASALAEVVIRFAGEEASPELFDILSRGLDRLTTAAAGDAASVALAIMWRIVAESGFAPAIDDCAMCHTAIAPGVGARFSHPAGGTLCDRCAGSQPSSRTLPPEARASLRAWLRDEDAGFLDDSATRAHQRLLREFLCRHMGDDRPMRALDVWERAALSAPAGHR